MNETQTTDVRPLTLRDLAAKRVVRLQDLAARAGMTRARFSHLINGSQPPVADEISRLAKVLRVPVAVCEQAAASTRQATV